MKYLITGGAGFIGSFIAEELLERGDEVFIIDDLSTGSIANIQHLKSNNRFHYHIDTIFNEPLVAELVDVADAIFHMAAAVGVMLIIEKPVHTIETNIIGTELVLKHATKKKKPTLIASTSEVYGKGSKVPFSENDDIILGPTTKSRWSYACSKMIDEFLAQAYFREKKLPTVIARIFNTVGPRQTGTYGMVIPRFVQQALSGGPITVYGDGKQTRCFAWVKDVVKGLIQLLNEPRSYGQIFNIGDDKEISIGDLAFKVRDMVNKDVEIKYIPYEQAYEEGFEDLHRRVPDLTKIRSLIGYKTTKNIDEILKEIIDYYKVSKK